MNECMLAKFFDKLFDSMVGYDFKKFNAGNTALDAW